MYIERASEAQFLSRSIHKFHQLFRITKKRLRGPSQSVSFFEPMRPNEIKTCNSATSILRIWFLKSANVDDSRDMLFTTKNSIANQISICFWSWLKDVRLLCVNIDRALIFGYDLHEHFMQLILKFGQYLQHSLFVT